MITIYNADCTVLLNIEVDDKSHYSAALMGDEKCTLIFSTAEFYEFPIGCFIIAECGIEPASNCTTGKYTLTKPAEFTMKHTREYEFTLVFESEAHLLRACIMKDNNYSPSLYLTAELPGHINFVVNNLNQMGGTLWELEDTGRLLLTTPHNPLHNVFKTIQYDKTNCYDALVEICNAFGVEFRITSHASVAWQQLTIHFRKIIIAKKIKGYSPLLEPIAYGKGNGVLGGIKRVCKNETFPVWRMYVKGGDKNLNINTYGTHLRLPSNGHMSYDGENFPNSPDYDGTKARHYETDNAGNFIQRENSTMHPHTFAYPINAQAAYENTEIFPQRVGEVASVSITYENAGTTQQVRYFNFTDTTPNMPDYWACREEGQSLTVIFQTGALAGIEFTVHRYTHATREFQLCEVEFEGILYPAQALSAQQGDKYIVTGCTMPQSYICDDNTRTGASWDLFREAIKEFYELEDFKYSFTCSLDPFFVQEKNLKNLIAGDELELQDDRWLPTPKKLRVLSLKRYINNRFKIELELSDARVQTGYIRRIAQDEAARTERVVNGTINQNEAAHARRSSNTNDSVRTITNSLQQQGQRTTEMEASILNINTLATAAEATASSAMDDASTAKKMAQTNNEAIFDNGKSRIEAAQTTAQNAISTAAKNELAIAEFNNYVFDEKTKDNRIIRAYELALQLQDNINYLRTVTEETIIALIQTQMQLANIDINGYPTDVPYAVWENTLFLFMEQTQDKFRLMTIPTDFPVRTWSNYGYKSEGKHRDIINDTGKALTVQGLANDEAEYNNLGLGCFYNSITLNPKERILLACRDFPVNDLVDKYGKPKPNSGIVNGMTTVKDGADNYFIEFWVIESRQQLNY